MYSVVFCSILFVFPTKWGNPAMTSTFSSAPSGVVASLPVTIINSTNETVFRNDSTNTSSINTQQPAYTPTPQTTTNNTIPAVTAAKNSISCADINICDKVRFGSDFPAIKKGPYYKAMLSTLINLQEILPQSPSLAETIYSVTITTSTEWDDRRWWWGSKTILLQTKNIANIQEFREVLTHETAHIVDLWMLYWNNLALNSSFFIGENPSFATDDPSLTFYTISWKNSTTRHAWSSYLDFVSGYGMSSPYEDFAESFTMFMWHNDLFKQWAQESPSLAAKYRFISDLTNGKFLSAGSLPSQKWTTWRPWDSTRMSLE